MRKLVPLLVLASPALADDPNLPRFEKAESGIATPYLGEWQYMVGGGAAVFDCNADARPDVFVAGGEGPAGLYRNLSEPGGELRFEPVPGMDAVAVTGAYPLDIDSDGITDLAVMRVGENQLMRGLGDCRFENANAAWGFDGGDAWSTAFAATWEPGADWPTLAVGNYIDRKEEAFPWGSCTDNWLHRPRALTGAAGFAPPLPLTPSFCALSMIFTDWAGNGVRDLRVSNDREYYKGGQEQLWHMEATPRLWSEAEGWKRLRIWGMGIAARDLDADGFNEFFLTSMADNKLQVLTPTEGRLPQYADQAFKRGATAHRPFTGGDLRPSTAWHAQFEDVNNDGLADLFVVKGNVHAMPDFAAKDPNNLLLQRADGTFFEAAEVAGALGFETSRGGAVVDFNADGRLDLLAVNRWEGPSLWRNVSEGLGGFVTVALAQAGANRDAIGSWVEVRTDKGLQRREITVGGGHMSGQLVPWHFGIGAAETAEVRVIWPDGVASDWVTAAPGEAVTLQR